MVVKIPKKENASKKNGDNGDQKKKPGFNPLALVIALFVLAIFHNMINSMNSVDGLTYNEFIEQIKLGNVEEVEISDLLIRGQFKQNSAPANEQGRKFSLVKD